MNKSRDVLSKLGKFLEQTLVNYKDLSTEIINICKSKRNDFIFKMKLTSKEETDIIKKRIDKIEKKIEEIEKQKKSKKAKRP